ncbi:MAG: SCO family protein, partial [Syntrophaceae bacterium]|nr:SCO family protein [Syntrophaceae bacterium]
MSDYPVHSLLRRVLILVLILFCDGWLFAHVEQHREQKGVGIDEKLGRLIPLDLTFRDENGKPIALRELIDRPTILAPVFLACPDVCSFLLSNLSGALNRLPADPGKDFLALTISYDETEGPPLAMEKKNLYLKMIEKPFPEEAWRFLTGDRESILKLMDAMGFYFKREGKNFLHPVALIILAPDGKITRYLYGTE